MLFGRENRERSGQSWEAEGWDRKENVLSLRNCLSVEGRLS